MAKKIKNSKIDALRTLAKHDPADDIISEVIPTGHTELDYYISRGLYQDEHGQDIQYNEEITYGIPVGKLVQMYGGEGSGKSSLAYRVCGNAQRMGKAVFWVDSENSFSPQLARINGVDTDEIVIQKMWDKEDPEKMFDAETILDIMMDACRKGAGVVVLDSVGSLIPRYVMENPADKDTMAALARVLGKTLGKLAGYAAANNVLVIFINQLQMNPGVSFGNPEGTKGGKTLAHMVSLTLKMTKLTAEKWLHFVETEKGEPEMIAGSASVQLQKNRFASPVRESIYIPIYYKFYFPDAEGVLFDFGRKTKVISVRTGVYSWSGIKGDGRSEFLSLLKDSGRIGDLLSEVKEAAEKQELPLPPEILNYEKHQHFKDSNKVFQNVSASDGEGSEYDPETAPKKRKKKTAVSKEAVLEAAVDNPEI